MEERPCERCGNEKAPFYDDEPNAPYCLDCLMGLIRTNADPSKTNA